MNRREWLRTRGLALLGVVVDSVAASYESTAPTQRRPPGAAEEANFLARCTKCGACSEACPHDAIHVFCDDTGLVAGTPVMLPDRRPCHMCDGFPCTSACDTGALSPIESASWQLGQVQVNESRCIAFAGPDCGACARHCPQGLDALELVRGKPRVTSASCVGCGLCIDACPTLPAAIELLPLQSKRSD